MKGIILNNIMHCITEREILFKNFNFKEDIDIERTYCLENITKKLNYGVFFFRYLFKKHDDNLSVKRI
jgi:hypothetical protein